MPRFEYERLSANDFTDGLRAACLDLSSFSRFFGVNFTTAERWAEGKQDIPVWVTVALKLMQLPRASQAARDASNKILVRDNKMPSLGEYPYRTDGRDHE